MTCTQSHLNSRGYGWEQQSHCNSSFTYYAAQVQLQQQRAAATNTYAQLLQLGMGISAAAVVSNAVVMAAAVAGLVQLPAAVPRLCGQQ